MKKMRKKILYLLSIGLLLSGISTANATNLLQQRGKFKDVYEAIPNMDSNTFERLMAQLQNYPIAHYLRYFYLKSHLDEVNAKTIQTFLDQYKNSPIAKRLRRAWLKKLAKKPDWETFLTAYTPQKNTILRCYHLQARIHTQKDLNASQLDEAKDLWLVGKSQPRECDPVFKYLYDNEIISTKMRWQRISLAIKKGNLRLARFIAKGLSRTDQKLVKVWQSLYKNPAKALKIFKYSDTENVRKMLLHGMKRLARKNAGSSYYYWQNYKKSYAFTSEENAELFRYIALMSATENHPEAAYWLAAVDKNLVDEKLAHARLRIALAKQNWHAVIKLVESLPVAVRDELKFKYWYARALEQTGDSSKANKLFQELAENRDYYGFLAAERLGTAYNFQSQPFVVSKEIKNKQLKKHAGMIRARELYFLGHIVLARVEWYAFLPKLSTKELKIAAALANQWGWHNLAIITIAKAKYFDALNIRFPVPFYDIVITKAEAQKLDFNYVYAVMRQESAFQTDARSVAGALGLMQLMPRTAKQVSRRQKIKLKNTYNLLVADINIALGTAHLRELLNQFNNNHMLATAGYNAGASRAKRWAKQYGCLPQDVWIELIPFNETRGYVQRVLSYMPVFEYQIVGHREVKRMPLDAIPTKMCSS